MLTVREQILALFSLFSIYNIFKKCEKNTKNIVKYLNIICIGKTLNGSPGLVLRIN